MYEWRRDESISLPYGLKTSEAGEMASSKKLLGREVWSSSQFSDDHNSYYTAYRYVTKEDREALHSSGHPDLTDGVPRTEAAITSRKKRQKTRAKARVKYEVKDGSVSVFTMSVREFNTRV